jgi:hypothetical protein
LPSSDTDESSDADHDADADDENTNSGSYRLDGLDPEDAKALEAILLENNVLVKKMPCMDTSRDLHSYKQFKVVSFASLSILQ